MTDPLATLDPSCRPQFTAALAACSARGIVLRVTRAADSPQNQARLWRQSRNTADVRDAVAFLRHHGAPWLAGVLEGVGPIATGPRVTGALPGLSWHQHRRAVDVVWLVDGKANWSTGQGSGYRVWREECIRVGLHRGPESDWAHMQEPAAGGPSMGWPELDDVMRREWS